MNNIFTTIKRFVRPDSQNTVIQVTAEMELIKTTFDFEYFSRLTDAMVEKAVKEIWKVHGKDIMRKVDKKTIGNLTVKKLSTMIAKELKV